MPKIGIACGVCWKEFEMDDESGFVSHYRTHSVWQRLCAWWTLCKCHTRIGAFVVGRWYIQKVVN